MQEREFNVDVALVWMLLVSNNNIILDIDICTLNDGKSDRSDGQSCD